MGLRTEKHTKITISALLKGLISINKSNTVTGTP